MGQQIVKQPDGRYAVWSSVVDDFVLVDATPEDIIADWTEAQRVEIYQRVWQVIRDLDEGGKPYYQFTKPFDECIERIKELHGERTESLTVLGLAPQE